ncbi:hypothetical protein CHARACLAT_021202 [Characodon lateralis]|uniref:Uncharacterized protein n=1 Tax=Characodon lateralis TaxID=208331 RepID=A0ABU7DT56_9TELE|nr:hypothetical protein [Characodon lateralis]
MFPEEINERCHAAATHVGADSLISLELGIDWLNPFKFSQDGVIVVRRLVERQLFSVFLKFIFFLFFLCSQLLNSGLHVWKKSQRQEDAGAAAPKRLPGKEECARLFNERGREEGSDTG